MIDRFSDKDPEEAIVLSVVFTPILDGETIQSAAWLITREDLPTEVTTAMLSGAVAITGDTVGQKVVGGNVGGSYIHRVKITTANRTLIHGVRQTVTYGA
jgi:hypothetical protein